MNNESDFINKTSLGGETTVFTFISPTLTKVIDIPAFVVGSLEQICTLGNCEPEIAYSGINTVVKVNLLNGT